MKFSPKEELDDEKKDKAKKTYQEPISDEHGKGHLKEEGIVEMEVDIDIGDKKREEQGEKEAAYQGIDQNFQEFHLTKIIIIRVFIRGSWFFYSKKLIPFLQNDIPVLENNIPVLQDCIPVLQNVIPVLENNIPVLQDCIPVLQNVIPVLQDCIPVLENNIPVLQDCIPVLQNVIPAEAGIQVYSRASGKPVLSINNFI